MTATLSLEEQLLLGAADRARRAPSVHNTQPWSFHLRSGELELHSDPSRALASLDPSGREMTLSCGAALLHLRLALLAQGTRAEVTAFPDAKRPHVVARVRVVGVGEPDPGAVELDACANARQTNRRAYKGTLTPEAVEVLRRAAELEGAELQPITDQIDRATIKVWQQAADAAQTSDPAYRRELRRWVSEHREDDGIPLAATVQPARPRHDLAARDFALSDDGGIEEGDDDPGTELFLVLTETDRPSAWLAAGQALARVWLEATRLGLALQPLSQSVEHPAVRAHVRRDLRLLSTWPQLLVRVGHAMPQPRTPRRSLADVVQLEPTHSGTKVS
jgi:nitroreductase